MKRWTVAVGVALALALLTLPSAPGFTISSFPLFGGEVAAASCEADAKPAPLDYILKDMNGDDVDLATFKGNVILLNFWATWCGPCIAELPYLRNAHDKLAAKGFEIFAVSLDEDREKTTKVITAKKMDWLHYFDGKKWKNTLAVAFDVHSIPANLLVDRQGIVRAVNLRGREIFTAARALLK